MIFPLLCISMIGLGLLLFGMGEYRKNNKQAWIFISIGITMTFLGVGLFLFSLWVFASGM